MIDRIWPDYNDTSKNPRWRWHRTYWDEGKPPPDDWCLYDGAGKQVARIMIEHDGRWRWTLGIRPDGSYANGGSGHCAKGTEARELCEQHVPGAVDAMK